MHHAMSGACRFQTAMVTSLEGRALESGRCADDHVFDLCATNHDVLIGHTAPQGEILEFRSMLRLPCIISCAASRTSFMHCGNYRYTQYASERERRLRSDLKVLGCRSEFDEWYIRGCQVPTVITNHSRLQRKSFCTMTTLNLLSRLYSPPCDPILGSNDALHVNSRPLNASEFAEAHELGALEEFYRLVCYCRHTQALSEV